MTPATVCMWSWSRQWAGYTWCNNNNSTRGEGTKNDDFFNLPGPLVDKVHVLSKLLVGGLLDGVPPLLQPVLPGVQLLEVYGEGLVRPVEAGGVGGPADDLDADHRVAVVVQNLSPNEVA